MTGIQQRQRLAAVSEAAPRAPLAKQCRRGLLQRNPADPNPNSPARRRPLRAPPAALAAGSRGAGRLRSPPCVSPSYLTDRRTVDRRPTAERPSRRLPSVAPPLQVEAGSKFVDLGADSLDTVEIMMALEEKFEVTVDEEGAEKISTVQVGDLTRLLVLQYWCCGTQMGAAAISGA